MPPNILARFRQKFVGGILRTALDRFIDFGSLAAPVIYVCVAKPSTKWEVMAPFVWWLCFIAAVHAVKATVELWAEILKQPSMEENESPIYSPSNARIKKITLHPRPSFYQAKLIAIILICLAPLAFVSILVGLEAKHSSFSASHAFSVIQDSVMIADTGIDSVMLWSYVELPAPPHICPIGGGFYLTVTNLQETAVMLASMTIEIADNSDDWIEDRQVLPHTSSLAWGTLSGPQSTSLAHLQLTDGFLRDKVEGKLLEPKVPVSGWVLVREEAEYSTFRPPRAYQIRIKDTAGTEYTQKLKPPSTKDTSLIGGAFSVAPPIPGNVQSLWNSRLCN